MTALAAVNAVFPGSVLTSSKLKRGIKVTEDIPENAEHEAAIEAFRQAFTLVTAQRRFVSEAAMPALEAVQSAIITLANVAKENPA